MLDIIITHYNEPYEVGDKLFQILNLQRGIDLNSFRVTVIHDGTDLFPEELFSNMRYRIRQIQIPHGGISAARNAGIEKSKEDWLMFCDFDDTFTNIYTLRDIMSVLPCDYDMLWTNIMVEDRTNNQDLVYLTPEKQRFVFVHGKVYRRQFLIEQNLRFKEGMPFQEDSLFNAIITARTDYKRIGEINTPNVPYVWIRRENSVTNSGRDDEAVYYHFLRNLKVTAENAAITEKYAGMVTRTTYDAYYAINGKHAGTEIKKRIRNEFRDWIKTRIAYFGKVSDDIMEQLIDVSRLELLEPGENICDDPETVKKWIMSIMKNGD